MCAPRDTTAPITIALTGQDWAEIAAQFDHIPHPKDSDPIGLTKLYEALAEQGLIAP